MAGKITRYERQLPILRKSGQANLEKSRIAVVGCGGLGSIASQYIAMSGAGFIRLIDYDKVEESNLNRQFFSVKDLGKPKASCLKDRLLSLNPDVKIEEIQEKLKPENAKNLILDCDIILDCLDSLEARLTLSAACQTLKKPLVHGSIHGISGQQITLLPGSGYLDFLKGKTQPKGKTPAIGPAPGIIGSLQALEAIKLITGCGKPNTQILLFDGEKNRVELVRM